MKITTTLQTQAKTYSLNLRDDDDTTQIIAVLGNRINTIKTELENIRSQKENATVQFESNLKNYDFLREIALLSAVLKKEKPIDAFMVLYDHYFKSHAPSRQASITDFPGTLFSVEDTGLAAPQEKRTSEFGMAAAAS